MRDKWKFRLLVVAWCVVYFGACQLCPGQTADPNADGITAWALLGTTPELAKMQEVRVGYEFGQNGWLPGIEFAVGGLHLDGPDEGVEEWSGRAYALAHALDASMIASLFGGKFQLPDGNFYAGLFAQYTYDRANEFSGGYVAGVQVAFPRAFSTIVEYQQNCWNNRNDSFTLVAGIRKKF